MYFFATMKDRACVTDGIVRARAMFNQLNRKMSREESLEEEYEPRGEWGEVGERTFSVPETFTACSRSGSLRIQPPTIAPGRERCIFNDFSVKVPRFLLVSLRSSSSSCLGFMLSLIQNYDQNLTYHADVI